jgi:hypothetical protein
MGRACIMHGRDEKIHTKFWLEKLKGKDHLEDLGIDGKIILELILGKQVKGWAGCIWQGMGTSGRLL